MPYCKCKDCPDKNCHEGEPPAQEVVDLLPCPFCGSKASYPFKYGGNDLVLCSNDGCHMSAGGVFPERWNRRAKYPKPPAQEGEDRFTLDQIVSVAESTRVNVVKQGFDGHPLSVFIERMHGLAASVKERK